MVLRGKAGIDRALHRRAAANASGRGDVDRQFRSVGTPRHPSPPIDQIALRHRVNLTVGAVKRRKHQRAAAQGFGLAQSRKR